MLNTTQANEIINKLEEIDWRQPWVRIGNKNAYFVHNVWIDEKTLIHSVIKSYNTIVGFVYENVLYEVGKYSTTTSKQITQIKNAYFPLAEREYRERIGRE